MCLFDCFGKFVQHYHRTNLILLQTFNDLDSGLEQLLPGFVHLIQSYYCFERSFSGLEHCDLRIEVLGFAVQRGIPPIAAASEAETDQKKDKGHHTDRYAQLNARPCRFFSLNSDEIDFNHRSNPLNAKPTATA